MRINVKFNALCLSVGSSVYKEKTYYNAQIFCPDSKQAGQIGINENLKEFLKENKNYEFTAQYDSNYSRLNVISATEVK